MIKLDWNVVSEAMRPQPDDGVREWLNSQAAKCFGGLVVLDQTGTFPSFSPAAGSVDSRQIASGARF